MNKSYTYFNLWFSKILENSYLLNNPIPELITLGKLQNITDLAGGQFKVIEKKNINKTIFENLQTRLWIKKYLVQLDIIPQRDILRNRTESIRTVNIGKFRWLCNVNKKHGLHTRFDGVAVRNTDIDFK